MGVPGCPEFAAWIASMDKVRMVLMLVRSMFCRAGESGGTVATLISKSFRAAVRWQASVVSKEIRWPGGGRRPPAHARSGHSERYGHLHPVISGVSMPFLYA